MTPSGWLSVGKVVILGRTGQERSAGWIQIDEATAMRSPFAAWMADPAKVLRPSEAMAQPFTTSRVRSAGKALRD